MLRISCSVFRGVRCADRWLWVVGLALLAVGYLGPWVPHKAAALTVTGLELSEFAKFFPQVQGGTSLIARELFYLPLVVACVLLALGTSPFARRPAAGLAWLTVASCVAALLLAVLLPYSVVSAVRQALSVRSKVVVDPQYVGQLRLVVAGIALVLLSSLAHRLPRRVQGALVALLALVGAALPLWQFARLYPLVVTLYGHAPGLGWGLVTCGIGSLLLLLSGITQACRP